ncbi:MAG: RraA family protein, partial [Flavitalea sp.]
MKKLALTLALFASITGYSQEVTMNSEQMKLLTPEWKGERYPDGRPKTDPKLLARLKKISIEEAWGFLRNKGYQNQYE